MIHITDKYKCCGCSSCVQVCPKQCITLEFDNEGFFYPIVDSSLCIDCKLCEKVCPYLNKLDEKSPKIVLAAINPSEIIRMQSSSGGVFSMIAEEVIHGGGVVFGARFDRDWNVVHDYTDNIDGLVAFRGSKYVQSVIGQSFIQAKKFLLAGRQVLFSGTPCQIAGLKLFLRKQYDNLITVECVCHGVPSNKLWRKYLQEQVAVDGKSIFDIDNIAFRCKDTGWKRYSMEIIYKDGQSTSCFHGTNPWIRSFIKNLNLRPSCFNCPSKCNTSFADITLGDFWGISTIYPEIDDDKGVSLIVYHTDIGRNILKNVDTKEVDFANIEARNNSLLLSANEPPKRAHFFDLAPKSFISTVEKFTKDSLFLRIKVFIAKIVRK